MSKDLAKRLKAARVESGLSVRAAAEEIGIGHMTLFRIESGTVKPDYYTRRNINQWLKGGKNQDAPTGRSHSHRIGDAEKRLSKLEDKVFKGKKKP